MADESPTYMFWIRMFMGAVFLMTGMMKLFMNSVFEGFMYNMLKEGSLLFGAIFEFLSKDNSPLLWYGFTYSLGMFEMLLGLALILGFLPRLAGLLSLIAMIPFTLSWIPNGSANIVMFWIVFMMHVVIFIGFSYLLFTKNSSIIWAPGEKWVPESLKRFQ